MPVSCRVMTFRKNAALKSRTVAASRGLPRHSSPAADAVSDKESIATVSKDPSPVIDLSSFHLRIVPETLALHSGCGQGSEQSKNRHGQGLMGTVVD